MAANGNQSPGREAGKRAHISNFKDLRRTAAHSITGALRALPRCYEPRHPTGAEIWGILKKRLLPVYYMI